jgi:hypothetical protein
MVDPFDLIMGLSKFDKIILTKGELERIVKDSIKKGFEPFIASQKQLLMGMEQIGKDAMSLLVMADKNATDMEMVIEQGKELSDELVQKRDENMWRYFSILNKILENRDYNPTPAMFAIMPADRENFNWDKWFNQRYAISPYCEYEQEIHRCEGVWFTFKKRKDWWLKAAPALGIVIRMLGTVVRIASRGVLVQMAPNVQQEEKYICDFMREFACKMEQVDTSEKSRTSDMSSGFVGDVNEKGIVDVRMRDLNDDQRIARIRLSELLKEIAPDKYKAQQWGPLKRIMMRDNTYRWLCNKHAEEYKK